jgi:hypothetical protein
MATLRPRSHTQTQAPAHMHIRMDTQMHMHKPMHTFMGLAIDKPLPMPSKWKKLE